MYIDFIADYGEKTGVDDLAFSEVNIKLCEEFDALGMSFPTIKTFLLGHLIQLKRVLL